MNGKKFTTMNGTLMCSLRVGECALIRCSSGVLRTSRVVSIRSVENSEICFETLNTVYRLLPAPVAQETGLSTAMMAA